ncbi:MAG TPA: DUF222 domain-containing protein [Mycobacteriales bacterium]|nr:DUF222 domain-containing protein [Mycobacteriales bacterium]
MQTDPDQLVEALCAGDLSALDQGALQASADGLRQLIGRLTGRLDQVLAELDVRGGGQVQTNVGSEHAPLYQSVQGWWRDSATVTGAQAGRDVRRAGILRSLPVLSDAVVSGVLAPEQAAVLCRLHGRIPLDALLDSQEQLVQVARELNPEALARFVRHLIATHCEPELDKEQARAHERRYLQLSHEPDGTVRGRFVLAAEDAEVVLTVLEPLARPQGLADKRSAGQRRADALVEVFAGAARWMELPQAGGQRPQLSYVLSEQWATRSPKPSLAAQLAADPHPHAASACGASAAWTGPQTRARIDTVLCDARITRLLVTDTGAVVELRSLTDEITPAQRRAVSTRDRHCLAKGCTRPPAFCDVHHLIARADGGPTSVENLALLCRRHHVLWHRGSLGHHDLHTPWLPEPDPEQTDHDPWARQNQPLIA